MTSQTLSSLAARSRSQKRCNEHIAWPSCARMATLHMNVHFRIFQKGQAPIKRSRQRKWPQACPYLDIMASLTRSPAHPLTYSPLESKRPSTIKSKMAGGWPYVNPKAPNTALSVCSACDSSRRCSVVVCGCAVSWFVGSRRSMP